MTLHAPPFLFLHVIPPPTAACHQDRLFFFFPIFTDWGSDDSGLWDIKERSCNNEELGIWPRVMSSGPCSGLAALSSAVIMKCCDFNCNNSGPSATAAPIPGVDEPRVASSCSDLGHV